MNDQPNAGMAQPDENGGPVQQLLFATKSPLSGASLDRDNEERKLVERAYTVSHPEPAGRFLAVRSFAEQVEGVRRVETLRLRKSGLEFFADIHIEVDADLTVTQGHHIGHRVKDALLHEFPATRDVLVHVEPHPPPKEGHGELEEGR